MPLENGASDAVMARNVSQLMSEGYTKNQAVAIAMEHAGRSNPKRDKAYQITQSEADYKPLSDVGGQACANCRWYTGGGCLIVENYPLPIEPTGVSNRWEAIPALAIPEPVIEIEMDERAASPGLIETIIKTVKEYFPALFKAQEVEPLSGFKALGNRKWVAYYSNNFEDKEGEYFPAAATDRFIERVDKGLVPMPELWLWHVPYRFGQAKALARVSADDSPNSPSMTVAVGEFDNSANSLTLEKALLKRNKQLPMSHGFFFPRGAKVDGVYHAYDTFEISVLPVPGTEANPFTLFEIGNNMPLPDAKKEEFEALLGKEVASHVIAIAEARTKEVKEKGVGYKEVELADEKARAELGEMRGMLNDAIKALNTLISAQQPAQKAEGDMPAKKKPDADSEDEEKKRLAAMKKELETAVKSVVEAQLKELLGFTPRLASKADETALLPTNPAVQAYMAAVSTDKKSADTVLFDAAFGGIVGKE